MMYWIYETMKIIIEDNIKALFIFPMLNNLMSVAFFTFCAEVASYLTKSNSSAIGQIYNIFNQKKIFLK